MKAPEWLTYSFARGVDERCLEANMECDPVPAYEGAWGNCWLAQFDSLERPCETTVQIAGNSMECFHFIGRQRVESSLALLLPRLIDFTDDGTEATIFFENRIEPPIGFDLIQLAEWDARNGGLACEAHHRRFDSHMGPELVVPLDALPEHVLEFASDYGFDELDSFYERFPKEAA